MIGRKNNDREIVRADIDMRAKTPVRRYDRLETGPFGRIDEKPVHQGRPAHLSSGANIVGREQGSQGPRQPDALPGTVSTAAHSVQLMCSFALAIVLRRPVLVFPIRVPEHCQKWPGRWLPAWWSSLSAQLRGVLVGRSLCPYFAIREALSAQPAMARFATDRAAARSSSFCALAPISTPRARVRACLASG